MGLVFDLTNKEKLLFGGALAFFVFWAYFLAESYANFFNGNTALGWFIFSGAYVFLVFGYIVKDNTHSLAPKEADDFIGIFFIFLLFDLIAYPFMIPKTGFTGGLAPIQMLSSDIAIYTILPETLAHNIKYFLTYVALPFLMLILARGFLTKRHFWSLVKWGV